jgi:tyrosyl-tRNA synthetase
MGDESRRSRIPDNLTQLLVRNHQLTQAAQEHFEKTVQHKELPSEIPHVQYTGQSHTSIIDLLVSLNLASSKSEAKRLVEQGGVEVDSKRLSDPNNSVEPKNDMIIKIGKRKIIRLKVE